MTESVNKQEQKARLGRGHYPKTEAEKTIWHKQIEERHGEYLRNREPKALRNLVVEIIDLHTKKGGTFDELVDCGWRELNLKDPVDLEKVIEITKQKFRDISKKRPRLSEDSESNEQLPATTNDRSAPTASGQELVEMLPSPLAPTLQDSDSIGQAMTPNPNRFWETDSPASPNFGSLPPPPPPDSFNNLPPLDISGSILPVTICLFQQNQKILQELTNMRQENVQLRTRLEVLEGAVWQRNEPNENDDNEMEPWTEPV
jgi:hypothetical protein